MAQFRGLLAGGRKEVTRLGSKSSGLRVEAQSWEGKVTVHLYHDDETGVDIAIVCLAPHHGKGSTRTIYHGPVSGASFTL